MRYFKIKLIRCRRSLTCVYCVSTFDFTVYRLVELLKLSRPKQWKVLSFCCFSKISNVMHHGMCVRLHLILNAQICDFNTKYLGFFSPCLFILHLGHTDCIYMNILPRLAFWPGRAFDHLHVQPHYRWVQALFTERVQKSRVFKSSFLSVLVSMLFSTFDIPSLQQHDRAVVHAGWFNGLFPALSWITNTAFFIIAFLLNDYWPRALWLQT